ncbi:MAG: MGMT family protein [Candidatus Hadarchaeum sp.]|uniref:MGMT family protein n=1 Tax=Candidatus Hadarchaeum sp. TaxID=2883567 RepID=UPI003D0A9BC9
MREFQRRVLELTAKVPRGKVTTYKQIALAMGKPKAYRAVARALAENPYPIKIPCHRVVRSDGNVGGYTGGVEKKIKLLRDEGVQIKKNKVLLSKYLFKL